MTGSSASLQLWLPHLGQCLSKEREHGNAEYRFAIAGCEGQCTNE